MISEATAQKKQNDILDAAADLFFKHGYESVSVDAIVKRVGGSKTTVYSYFGGKDGLFLATVRRLIEEMLRPLATLDVIKLGPEEGLRAIGSKFLEMLVNGSGRCLFLTVLSEARRFPCLGVEFFSAGPAAVVRIVSGSIRHWQREGYLAAGDPNALAEEFIGGLMGTAHTANLLGIDPGLTPESIKKRVETRTRHFLAGAASRPKSLTAE